MPNSIVFVYVQYVCMCAKSHFSLDVFVRKNVSIGICITSYTIDKEVKCMNQTFQENLDLNATKVLFSSSFFHSFKIELCPLCATSSRSWLSSQILMPLKLAQLSPVLKRLTYRSQSRASCGNSNGSIVDSSFVFFVSQMNISWDRKIETILAHFGSHFNMEYLA